MHFHYLVFFALTTTANTHSRLCSIICFLLDSGNCRTRDPQVARGPHKDIGAGEFSW